MTTRLTVRDRFELSAQSRESRYQMTSQAIRDALADHLITPQNSAFVFIDYQPEQFATPPSRTSGIHVRPV